MAEDTSAVEDKGISMVEILQEEEELQQDANAVLGAADDSQCSYSLNYMKRQALYACLTCCPADSEPAGVCLACIYQCHEDHNLVELYTKRHFRCDCGNSKFSNKCKLNQDKSSKNEENQYNQNFKGVYCNCKRPYPDPDISNDDEMIQCCICEDWYHSMHLGNVQVPEGDSYSEMMCHPCAKQLPFIRQYIGLTVTAVKLDSETKAEINVSEVKDATADKESIDNNSKNVEISSESNLDRCKLTTNKMQELPDGALFFTEKWRESLCTCDSCKAIYKSSKVEYLLDIEDTVAYHEARGSDKKKTTGVQQELEALSSLDRITQIEMVHEYNNLSSSLREYLKKFADNGKVVKDDDIKEFFTQFKANKKQKTGPGLQFSCK